MNYNKGDKLEDSETLLRRVYRKDKRYIDPKTGRPSSRAFSPRPKDEGKLSVDIERLTTYEKAISDPTKFMLFSFFAELPHQLGLECIYDPKIDAENNFENLAHSLVIGFEEEDESIPGILSRKVKQIDYPPEV